MKLRTGITTTTSLLIFFIGFFAGSESQATTSKFSSLQRPPQVSSLKLVSLDKKLVTLKISWDLSPKSAKVDSYLDHSGGTLVDITKQNSVTINLSFTDNSDGLYKPKHFPIHPGTDAQVWVIAHNKAGWGQNDPYTADPNYWLSNTVPKSFGSLGIYPKVIEITFPCIKTTAAIAAEAALGFCGQ